MSYKEKSVRVSSLDLDLVNPRFRDGVGNQRSALAELLKSEKQQSEVLALARSIVDLRGLDPATLLVVVNEEGRKVVLEGNRRVAALKLLRRPSLAPTESLRKRFERLASSWGEVPDSVRVVIYDERSEYDPHLMLRHTGENGGAGLKPWRAPETARFRERSEGAAGIHTELLKWCDQQYEGDQEVLDLVERIRSARLTTLKRVLMKSVRSRLGLVYSKRSLTVEYTASQLRAFLVQLFSDIMDGVTPQGQPWSRANQADVEQYVLTDHVDLLPAEDDRIQGETSGAPEPQDAANVGDGTAPSAAGEADSPSAGVEDPGSGGGNSERSPLGPPPQPDNDQDHEKRLFPGVRFDQFGARVNALGQQAQKVSIDSNPELCGVLCRVVVDLACTKFLSRHGKEVRDNAVWRRVVASLRILDPAVDNAKQCQAPELHHVWSRSDQGQHGLAVETMNDFVHSMQGRTGASEVRHHSALYTPLLVAMEANLRQAPAGVATGDTIGHS